MSLHVIICMHYFCNYCMMKWSTWLVEWWWILLIILIFFMALGNRIRKSIQHNIKVVQSWCQFVNLDFLCCTILMLCNIDTYAMKRLIEFGFLHHVKLHALQSLDAMKSLCYFITLNLTLHNFLCFQSWCYVILMLVWRKY